MTLAPTPNRGPFAGRSRRRRSRLGCPGEKSSSTSVKATERSGKVESGKVEKSMGIRLLTLFVPVLALSAVAASQAPKPVDEARLTGADGDTGNWLMYGRT